nr:reverse transcriptase domain-containing protein [Tanacetum cinerariifolium]
MDLKNKLETTTKNQQASIQNLKTKFDRLADKQFGRPFEFLPSNTQPNPKGSSSKPYQPPQAQNEYVNVVFTRSGKSYDLPDNPNDQQNDFETPINCDSDDEDDEPTPQPKPKTPKPVKETLTLKQYKPKIPYPQHLRKNGSSIWKIPRHDLSRSNQQMEEDSEVSLILGIPFLHIVDALIRVKQKKLNLGVGTERMIFHIDFAMKHSYSNDDTCFSIDVIDEILEEDSDALLDEESVEVFMDDFSVFGSSFDHCKTVNAAQQNYTITKKELMAVVFAFDKFRSYMVLSKMIVHTNHSALRHLFKKQNAKPRLIYWILLLQEFNIEIKDRKGTENVTADDLSQIENEETSDDSEVDENFLGETLMEINTEDEPRFVDFGNYLASDIIPKGMTYQQKNFFLRHQTLLLGGTLPLQSSLEVISSSKEIKFKCFFLLESKLKEKKNHIYFARMVRLGVLNDALKNMYNDEKKGKRQVMTRPSKVVI